jgi:hypothetical protein
MKTDDLVKALAADAKSVEPPITRTLAVAIALGTVISLVCFLRALGVRPDFLQSMTDSGRFIFKFMLTLSVAVPGFVLLRGMSRPDFVPGNRLWWLALAPVLLSAAVAFELLSVPIDAWHAQMMGHNSHNCLTIIPLLSLPPFVTVIYALRSGAPANPTMAGAIGGLLSAGIAATLYASNCTDDSPLFVGLWYPIGFALMATLGAWTGSKILPW